MVILQTYFTSYNYQQDKSTYYDCWIILQTALKIAASNLYCKITLVCLDSSLSAYGSQGKLWKNTNLTRKSIKEKRWLDIGSRNSLHWHKVWVQTERNRCANRCIKKLYTAIVRIFTLSFWIYWPKLFCTQFNKVVEGVKTMRLPGSLQRVKLSADSLGHHNQNDTCYIKNTLWKVFNRTWHRMN